MTGLYRLHKTVSYERGEQNLSYGHGSGPLTWCVPAGLGRSGQLAVWGLYSLSKHC